MGQDVPINRRQPGGLPNILGKLAPARSAVSSLPESPLRGAILSIVNTLEATFRVQHELNRRLWDGYDSLPGKHAPTHMGGNDSVSGTQLPSPITFFETGARGTPASGYAPIDHKHPTNLANFPGLTGVDTDPVDGTSVIDHALRRLLEAIFLELECLEADFARLVDSDLALAVGVAASLPAYDPVTDPFALAVRG